MDRKTLLAISLCFLIYAGWQKFIIEPRMPLQNSVYSQQQNAALQSAPTSFPTSSPQNGHGKKFRSTEPSETRMLETKIGQAVVGDSWNMFVGWTLKSYKTALSAEASAIDLHSVTQQPGALTLSFDDPSLAYLRDVQGSFISSSQGVAWHFEDENIQIIREFSSNSESPAVDVRLKIQGKKIHPKYAFISLAAQSSEKDPEAQDRQLFYWTNQSLERVALKESLSQQGASTAVDFIGTSNRYFIMTALASTPSPANALVQPIGSYAGRISLIYPMNDSSITIPLSVYFGPKELDLLRQVHPHLDSTIDFGWFTLFAYPLLTILKLLYQYVQNYGVAIILLTLLLKIVTFPLTYKSMKSMKKMAKIQPELQRLKERFKDDREAQNREMLQMMKTHGYNPAAGCLPMLVQMPIFFALYRVLYSSIELYHAPFAFWIQDLSSRDAFYVTPVLLSVTMFFQQKLTPNTATDPAQQKMMQLMPIIFGAFMLTVPAGLTIYMLVNAMASIVQQIFLNKKLDGGVPAAR